MQSADRIKLLFYWWLDPKGGIHPPEFKHLEVSCRYPSELWERIGFPRGWINSTGIFFFRVCGNINFWTPRVSPWETLIETLIGGKTGAEESQIHSLIAGLPSLIKSLTYWNIDVQVASCMMLFWDPGNAEGLEWATHSGFSCYTQKSHQGSAQHPGDILQGSPKQQKLAPCQLFCAVEIRDWSSSREVVLEMSLRSSLWRQRTCENSDLCSDLVIRTQ